MKKYFACFLLSVLCLTACTADKYAQSFSNKIETSAEEMMRDYLEQKYPDYQLEEVSMLTSSTVDGNIYSGYYGSRCAQGYFEVGDDKYKIVVDLEKKQVYTNEYEADICYDIKRRLKEYLSQHGYDDEIIVQYLEVDYEIINHDIPDGKFSRNTMDAELHLFDVFPADSASLSIENFVETGMADAVFYQLSVLYSGGEQDRLPLLAIEDFMKDYPFFAAGEMKLINLYEADFDKILAGEAQYDWRAEKYGMKTAGLDEDDLLYYTMEEN